MKNNYFKKNNNGYVTLISVLIAGAVGLSISLNLFLLQVSGVRANDIQIKSSLAKSFANACVETALENIRNNTSYTGSDNLSFSLGSCTFTVVNTGGESRTISIEGVSGETNRKVFVIISSINPLISVSSWQEVP